MPTETAQLSRDRQILQAAAELFFERGFAATGVDAIGKRVGISGPAIYSHFKGKDEILATLALEGIEGLLDRIGKPQDDPRAELESLVRSHVDEILRDRHLASVYVTEGKALSPELRERIGARLAQYRARWIVTLERCWPDQDRQSLTAAANAAMGLANSAVLWSEEVFETPGLADMLVAMSLGALSVLDA